MVPLDDIPNGISPPMNPGWRYYKPDQRHPWADIVPIADDHPLPHAVSSFEESRACHCQPKVVTHADDGAPMLYPLVVHSAHDGRELIEEAEGILRRMGRAS